MLGALDEPPLYDSRAARLAHALGQLLARVVLDVGLLVVVRRDLAQPLGLDLDDLAHELLGGEDELVVDDPARLRLVERGGGVDVHGLRVLDGAVVEALLQLGCVVEEARGDRLGRVRARVGARATARVRVGARAKAG